MFLGYNTNGLAHHDLFDAVELLAEIGYRGVAITIDHNALPPGDCPNFRLSENGTVPFARRNGQRIARLRQLLEKLGMRSVIETGARFLLDPRVKHEPTLLSESPRRRIDFYKYAVDCAAELGSDCVSLWSGALGTGSRLSAEGTSGEQTSADNHGRPRRPHQQAMDRLVDGLREVLDYAATQERPDRFRARAGHVHRHDAGVRGTA